jgi:hypothetical protein
MALRGSNSHASFAMTLGFSCCSGVTSSMIQMLRPCVDNTRSLSRGWTRISSIRTTGRFVMNGFQLLPSSSDT